MKNLSQKPSYVIKLYTEYPLKGLVDVLADAAKTSGKTLTREMDKARESCGIDCSYITISNYRKLNGLSEPGLRMLGALIELSSRLKVDLFLQAGICSEPVKLKSKRTQG